MSTLPTSRRHFLLSTAGFASVAGMGPTLLSAADAGQGGGSGVASSSKAVPLAPPDKQPPNLKVPGKPGKQAGWAIVGLGELALGEVMPAFADCKLSRPVALVSGHPDKARKVAGAYGMNPDFIYNYEDYDRLAENKEVDIIYIILPNSMHEEFTIRGLKAGKHVLCEKPLSVTVEESERMVAAAKEADRHLMTAYRLHYEPFNQKAMELCKDGTLGKIKSFVSTNAQDVKAPNIRLSGPLGGGPLGDVGVYSINAARYTIGEEPVEVWAVARQPEDDPRFREVPESVAYTMRYPSGALAHCGCSFGTAESRFYRVLGTKGCLHMDPAFSYRGLNLELRTEEGATEMKLEQVDHFAAEMDHFSEVVLNGTKCRTPGEMGLADMRILAALEESIKTGAPVKVGA